MKIILSIARLLLVSAPSLIILIGCGGAPVPPSNVGSSGGAGTAASLYSIGGSVSGGNGPFILQNNGGDNLAISANGKFAFTTSVKNNSTYNVTVLTQPNGQICTVNTGVGTVSGSNVTNVAVICSVDTFNVGGLVSGLSGALVLQVNNADNLTISANGNFNFATKMANGSPYSVTVLSQPSGQNCSVVNGTGTISSSNISNVSINCGVSSYTIGGIVTGLNGSMVLQDNGADNFAISVNGNFSFASTIAYGNPYNVTVTTQPSGYSCSVTNGSGIVSANVNNVVVSCVKLPPVCFAYVAQTTGNVAAYKIDAATGSLSNIGISIAGNTPIAIVADPMGKFVYVANTGNSANGSTGLGSVTAYKVDPAMGTLTEVVGSPFVTGSNPSSLTIDPSGKFIYVTNRIFYSLYTPPSVDYVSTYAIDRTTGALSFVNSVPTKYGASSVTVEPLDRFAYVANALSANISAYKIDAMTGALVINGVIGPDVVPYTPPPPLPGQVRIATPDTNPHPSSIAADLSGKFVYMADSNSINISEYSIDTTGGLLSNTGVLQTTGLSYSITTSPTNNFAYVAVVGNPSVQASISAYKIDAATGALSAVTGSPFLMGLSLVPRSITIDSFGKFAYVVSYPYVTNTTAYPSITEFSIDATTGGLTMIGSPLGVGGGNPVSVTTTCTNK
jgi:6-phosphogluconolactonase (cycloisomerase 2 family)